MSTDEKVEAPRQEMQEEERKRLSEIRKKEPVSFGEVHCHVSNSGFTFEVLDRGHGPTIKLSSSTFGNMIQTAEFMVDLPTLAALGSLFTRASNQRDQKWNPIGISTDYPFAGNYRDPKSQTKGVLATLTDILNQGTAGPNLQKIIQSAAQMAAKLSPFPQLLFILHKGRPIGITAPPRWFPEAGLYEFKSLMISETALEKGIPDRSLEQLSARIDMLHQIEHMLEELTMEDSETGAVQGVYTVQSFNEISASAKFAIVDKVIARKIK